MSDIGTSQSIVIEAPIDRVWEAVTTPDQIKQWFFGVDTETDWTEGSSIVHRGEYQGQAYEDRGTILEIQPPRTLVHTHWSPASGLPDEPENYERISWELAERDGSTELTISESNLASEEAKETSEQNWTMVLGKLKELLEG
ncbi:MAG TPA: SRPBCC domain-containing protein [Actinomycetota bacterium]|nr:SRPBCC domain-containing protein [Actinomycetota bacterium]